MTEDFRRVLHPIENRPEWKEDDPLAHIKWESEAAHQALVDFWRMGPTRTPGKLARKYANMPHDIEVEPPTRSFGTIQTWCREKWWRARIRAAHNLHIQQQEALWRQRQLELRQQDWELGNKLRQQVLDFLDLVPFFEKKRVGMHVDAEGRRYKVFTVRLNVSLPQLAQAAKVASELQRVAVETGAIPTSALAHVDMENLTLEQLERISGGENIISVLADTSASRNRSSPSSQEEEGSSTTITN